jgi:hypothetical protein
VVAVLDADHDDFARLLVDSVEHPVGASAGGPDSVQIESQWLAYPLWVGYQTGGEELDCGGSYRLWKGAGERRTGGVVSGRARSRSPAQPSYLFHPTKDISAGVCLVGFADVGKRLRVGQHRDRLLEFRQVIWADQDGCYATISGQHDALMLVLYPVDEL